MILRLLANENIPQPLVAALRDAGHDVAWVATLAAGAEDAAVLRLAAEQGRICLTQDKDFGELAARTPAAARHGIILLRLALHRPDALTHVVALLGARDDWTGQMSVIEPARLRMRPIAPPEPGPPEPP